MWKLIGYALALSAAVLWLSDWIGWVWAFAVVGVALEIFIYGGAR